MTDIAICLNQWDWSETSQTAALLTSGEGLIRVVAKGSKREKSPYSGGLGVLTMGEAVYLSRQTPGLVTLTSWDLRDGFPWLRASLGSLNAAYFASDAAMHILQEHDAHPRTFDAMRQLLGSLRTSNPMAALARYLWVLLDECGFMPELDRDVDSGEPIAKSPVMHFAPAAGGLVLGRDGSGRVVWDVRAQTIACLLSVRDGRMDGENTGHEQWAGAAKLLASYVAWVVQRLPPAYSSVFGPPPKGIPV